MAIKINSIKVVTEFVDDTTGEIFTDERVLGQETKKEKRTSSRSKAPKDDDPVAKITVLDNKLQFNKAGVELTQFEPEQHISIQFEKRGRVVTPLISVNDKGNRLTKTYTVSFRGQQRDTLLQYGTIFEIIPYEDKEGIFKLKGDAPEVEDDIVDIPEEMSSTEDIENSLDEINLDDFTF